MLVEQPHALGRVNGAAAADSDDNRQAGRRAWPYTAHDALHAGVALHVGVRSRCMAVLLPLARGGTAPCPHCPACTITGSVTKINAWVMSSIFSGTGWNPLKIDFGRDLEPLHIHSPFGDALFVDEVDGGHVLAHGVLAVAAAQSKDGVLVL